VISVLLYLDLERLLAGHSAFDCTFKLLVAGSCSRRDQCAIVFGSGEVACKSFSLCIAMLLPGAEDSDDVASDASSGNVQFSIAIMLYSIVFG
jgi:hypothetical protein